MARVARLKNIASLAIVLAILAASASACGSPAAPSPGLTGGVLAAFTVETESFKVFVTNATAIDRLFQLERGQIAGLFPNGRILRGSGAGNHNAPHPWHLDPGDIEMVDLAIELCDGRPSYVDANVGEYVDVVGRYCPWGATLVSITDYR